MSQIPQTDAVFGCCHFSRENNQLNSRFLERHYETNQTEICNITTGSSEPWSGTYRTTWNEDTMELTADLEITPADNGLHTLRWTNIQRREEGSDLSRENYRYEGKGYQVEIGGEKILVAYYMQTRI